MPPKVTPGQMKGMFGTVYGLDISPFPKAVLFALLRNADYLRRPVRIVIPATHKELGDRCLIELFDMTIARARPLRFNSLLEATGTPLRLQVHTEEEGPSNVVVSLEPSEFADIDDTPHTEIPFDVEALMYRAPNLQAPEHEVSDG